MIETFTLSGKTVYRLKDPSGSFIDVVPEQGNTVIGFCVPHEKESLNVLYQPEDFINNSGGIPVMWPFANRIKDGRFFRDAQEHHIFAAPGTTDDQKGNVIHGLVRKIPWDIVESGDCDRGVFISSRVRTCNAPEIEKHFGQGVLTVTYCLRGMELAVLTEIENTGDMTFPMSWAFHPWFKAPLTDRSTRQEIILQIPATKRWETKKNIPTGRLLPLSGKYNFKKKKKLENMEFDDVYTGLDFTENDGKLCSVSKISDPLSGIDITITSDSAYKHLVFFAPLNKPTLCIEPQTSPTNAFNLDADMADLIELAPGQKKRAEFKITISIKENQYVSKN